MQLKRTLQQICISIIMEMLCQIITNGRLTPEEARFFLTPEEARFFLLAVFLLAVFLLAVFQLLSTYTKPHASLLLAVFLLAIL